MIDRYASSPISSRLTDDDHEHAVAALGPWHDAAEPLLAPRPPPRDRTKSSRPSKSPSTRATAALSSRPALPLLDLGRVASSHLLPVQTRKLDASPVMDAYRALVEQTDTMERELTQRSEARQTMAAALRAGVDSLSPALVDEQKKLLRLQGLHNEVAIFQQHLDPFVFEIRSAREHEVRSSVYRHFTRMRAVQDLGVPIYGIGEYEHEATDRVLVPRTAHRIYRRVRRRDAMHFIDTDLIPRPVVNRRKRDTKDRGDGDGASDDQSKLRASLT